MFLCTYLLNIELPVSGNIPMQSQSIARVSNTDRWGVNGKVLVDFIIVTWRININAYSYSFMT